MSNQEQDTPGAPGAQAGEDAPAAPGPGISSGNQSPGQQLLVGWAERDLGFPPQGGSRVTSRREDAGGQTSPVPVSSDLPACRAALRSGPLGVASGPMLILGNLKTVCGVTR